jgi:hypothetical protein
MTPQERTERARNAARAGSARLTPQERTERAQLAARARWERDRAPDPVPEPGDPLCPQGLHPMTGSNVATSAGRTRCRACHRAIRRARQAARRQAEADQEPGAAA